MSSFFMQGVIFVRIPVIICASVIERMYDLSKSSSGKIKGTRPFQLLLKECTIEAVLFRKVVEQADLFQLLLKECTIEALH